MTLPPCTVGLACADYSSAHRRSASHPCRYVDGCNLLKTNSELHCELQTHEPLSDGDTLPPCSDNPCTNMTDRRHRDRYSHPCRFGSSCSMNRVDNLQHFIQFTHPPGVGSGHPELSEAEKQLLSSVLGSDMKEMKGGGRLKHKKYDPSQVECVLYLVRHGERIDKVDRTWVATAERPFDPPLTTTGLSQAAATGVALRGQIIHQLNKDKDSKDCIPLILHGGLGELLFFKWFSKVPALLSSSALKSVSPYITDVIPIVPAPKHAGGSVASPSEQESIVQEESTDLKDAAWIVTEEADVDVVPDGVDISSTKLESDEYELSKAWPERRADSAVRISLAVRSIARAHQKKETETKVPRIALVTHGGVVSAAVAALGHVHLSGSAARYCSITSLVRISGRWYVDELNSVHHLKGQLPEPEVSEIAEEASKTAAVAKEVAAEPQQ